NLTSQVGMLVAAMLDFPSVYAVTKIEKGDEPQSLTVTRDLGRGIRQVLAVPLPALLAVDSGGQTLSYAPPMKVIRARRSPLQVLTPADLGLTKDELSGPRWFKIAEVGVPERRQQAELLEGNSKMIAASILERIRDAAG
ncbi:MAG: electron transfer flavoprotein subunit beta/FixA family protein, partial [Anaerolineae bacterium]